MSTSSTGRGKAVLLVGCVALALYLLGTEDRKDRKDREGPQAPVTDRSLDREAVHTLPWRGIDGIVPASDGEGLRFNYSISIDTLKKVHTCVARWRRGGRVW